MEKELIGVQQKQADKENVWIHNQRMDRPVTGRDST